MSFKDHIATMIKKVAQRNSFMKTIGWIYIGLAIVLTVIGLAFSMSLFRADFYADYRRGAHLVAGFAVLGVFLLLALGMFVQGSMANAVADIDTHTRVNADAIEETRRVTESAVRTGQNALRTSEAMIHAQAALQAAQAQAALPPMRQPAVLDAAGATITHMSEEPAETFGAESPVTAALVERTAGDLKPPGLDESLVNGVIGVGGNVTTLANDPIETEVPITPADLDEPRQPAPPAAETVLRVPEPEATTLSTVDAKLQNLFGRSAKGSVVRSRRPWSRD
jgi:hypothetical protein